MMVENPLNLQLRQPAALTAGSERPRFTSPQPLSGRFSRRATARNNSLATATVLPVVPPNLRRTIRDQVGRGDRVDYFKLTLTRQGNIDITLRNRSQAPLVGSLLDATGQILSYRGSRQSTSVKAGNQITRAYKGLSAGVYYMRVHSNAEGNNRYELTLALRTAPSPLPCGCGT
ncbi:MAG: hypothetical protein IGS50_08370 [Synechococcales cyanobacterium C42_A2020_086]|nr:hypothetical protein [Synechococcales cyanobacterium C42_A2020_086]